MYNYEQEMEKVYIREQQGVFCRSLLKHGFDVYNHTFHEDKEPFFLLIHSSGARLKYYINGGIFSVEVSGVWGELGLFCYPTSTGSKKKMLALVLSAVQPANIKQA